MEFRCTALTDLWTGGIDSRRSDKLHITSIKGSIRWWYEAVIRGLGYYACDPHSDSCSVNQDDIKSNEKIEPQIKKQICPSCYLFGCTGWSAKFNLRIKDLNNEIWREPIRARNEFVVELVEKRALESFEKDLLKATMQIISQYGAVGGRTTFKPSEIPHKNTKLHHQNYGIIRLNEQVAQFPIVTSFENYLNKFKKKENISLYPDLRYFWFVQNKHINRSQHNSLVGRDSNGNLTRKTTKEDIWLAGFIGREKRTNLILENEKEFAGINAASKRIFSFHGLGTAKSTERCFGYTKKSEFDGFIGRLLLTADWKKPDGAKYTRDDIIRFINLFSTERR